MNVLTISATVHEDNAVNSDVTPNVSDALAEGNDQTATELEPKEERSAADLSVIDSTSQPMELATNTDSNHYPRRVHRPPQCYHQTLICRAYSF